MRKWTALLVIFSSAFILQGCPKNAEETGPKIVQAREKPDTAETLPAPEAAEAGPTYECPEHGFSISFPPGWSLADASGQLAVKRAVSGDGASITLLVKEYGPGSNMDVNGMTDQELLNVSGQYLNSIKRRDPNAVVLSNEIRTLGNKKAGFVKVEYVETVGGERMPCRKFNYITFHNNKMYNVIGKAEKSDYGNCEHEMETAAASFRFDDVSDAWQDTGAAPPATMARTDPDRYYNREYGFSMLFPPGWEISEGYMGSAVAAASPESRNQMVGASIVVGLEELPPGVTEQQFAAYSVEVLRLLLNDFEVRGEGKTYIDGKPARWILYSGSMGRIEVAALQYFVMFGNTGLVITCMSSPGQFNMYRKTFDDTARSFKLEGVKTYYKRG